jgi:hypothetical protein
MNFVTPHQPHPDFSSPHPANGTWHNSQAGPSFWVVNWLNTLLRFVTAAIRHLDVPTQA